MLVVSDMQTCVCCSNSPYQDLQPISYQSKREPVEQMYTRCFRGKLQLWAKERWSYRGGKSKLLPPPWLLDCVRKPKAIQNGEDETSQPLLPVGELLIIFIVLGKKKKRQHHKLLKKRIHHSDKNRAFGFFFFFLSEPVFLQPINPVTE